MAKKYLRMSWIVVCSLIFYFSFSGCQKNSSIPIGFTAQLTGKQADLGVHLRNGVEMAIDEINAAGGINGRDLELLIEDDFGTPQGAVDAETKLIDDGVVAIIGHFTSAQTVAGYEVAEQRGVLLLSATASTSEMTGIEDLFYRTVASTDAMGHAFSAYIHNDKNIDSIAIIFDEDNKSYSEPLVKAFVESFNQSGGKVSFLARFSSFNSPDYTISVKKMKESDADAVLIIASPYDTAIIVQSILLQNWNPALFTSSWAQSDTLFETGGKTLEGMETIVGFDINDQNPALLTFKEKYQQKYGVAPIFTSMEGYETMQLLARALELTEGGADGLGSSLVSVQDFVGLTGPLKLDLYGDVLRSLVIQKVINGKFETIKYLDVAD